MSNVTGKRPGIRGYAAVYSSLSRDLGGFREEIAPGTFTKALAREPDVIATWDHDPALLLGRTSSGTLSLRDTSYGLLAEITELPDTPIGRDVAEKIRRGEIHKMSFSFMAPSYNRSTRNVGGHAIDIRTLTDCMLVDVAVLSGRPAYNATSVELCSLSPRPASIHRVLLDLLCKI
jgi:uncharacterized protein